MKMNALLWGAVAGYIGFLVAVGLILAGGFSLNWGVLAGAVIPTALLVGGLAAK